jgi:hypothetical protein
MITLVTTLVLAGLPTPQDFLEGAELGDASQYVALRSNNQFEANVGSGATATVVNGSWSMKGDTLEVKTTACKGPACKDVKKDFTAQVEVVAPRALTLQSTAPAPLVQSGSYYCHSMGCEQRIGVVIVAQQPRRLLNAVEDGLIDQNRGRNATVVWVGAKAAQPSDKTRIEVCGRDSARAKKGAELVLADVKKALPWIGEPVLVEKPATNCLWDVQLVVSDAVQLPPKPKK